MSDVKNILDNIEQGSKIADNGLSIIEKILLHIPQYQEHQIYIDAINNNQELSVPQKMVLTRSYTRFKKELKNRIDIYNEAINMLESDGENFKYNFKTIDDEWFAIYDDIVKNISDEMMRYIWAKILADKCKDKNSISKKTLLVLQSIEYEDAKIFTYMCSNTLMYRFLDSPAEIPVFLETSMESPEEILSKKSIKRINVYDEDKINTAAILRLKEMGLITQISPLEQICFIDDIMIARYFGTQIQIKLSSNKIEYGSIQYTFAGIELAKIIYGGLKDQINDKLPQAVVDYYNSKGYEAAII